MMKRLLLLPILIAFLIITYILFLTPPTKLEKANESFDAAVQSKTIYNRKTLFNDALTLYSQLERTYQPILGNGKIYNNLGETFFELESYPWALLNFYRAQKLGPNNPVIEKNINKTLEKLSLPQQESSPTFQNIFFFHFFSLPKRLQLLFFFGIIAFSLASLYLWNPKKWLIQGTILATILCILFTISTLYTRYMEPMQGILLQATLITREPGNSADWITPTPTPAGTKVNILGVFQNGVWLKITTPEGDLGFVSSERIRII